MSEQPYADDNTSKMLYDQQPAQDAGDETMTGQAQEWQLAWGFGVGPCITRGGVLTYVEINETLVENLNSLTRDLAQARAEAEDVAATAHMMGHASRNDEVRALQAEVELLTALADDATRENWKLVMSAGESETARLDAEAQLAQAMEALEDARKDFAQIEQFTDGLLNDRYQARGIADYARDALHRLQGGGS